MLRKTPHNFYSILKTLNIKKPGYPKLHAGTAIWNQKPEVISMANSEKVYVSMLIFPLL